MAKIADDNQTKCQDATMILKRDFYVDDLITGCSTVAEATTLRENLTKMLGDAGLHLRKWTSNNHTFLDGIPITDRQLTPKTLETDDTVKILGLQWQPKDDAFYFSVNLDDETHIRVKKRKFLSEASKLFGPLGWLAPVIITVKVLFQSLWLEKLTWDQELLSRILEEWCKIRRRLKDIENIKIPRWLKTTKKPIQLHSFCDASQKALAATIYCRTEDDNGVVHVTLITAKTKVAPLKQRTIPKLELCAAVMSRKLLLLVKETLALKVEKWFAWTDSIIVLDWLSHHPRTLETYVANRTSEILSTTGRLCWYHVPSLHNPADCASRGLTPNQLLTFDLWWKGPEWLRQSEDHWPVQNTITYHKSRELPCVRPKYIVAHIIREDEHFCHQVLNQYSSFYKYCKILAMVFRIITNMRMPAKQRQFATIQGDEILNAADKFVIWHQGYVFSDEITALKDKRSVARNSKLKMLDPFVDSQGILRVGSRINQSTAAYEVKHPAIISNTRLAYLIAEELHIKNHNAGPTLLSTLIRLKYWVIGARQLINKIIHHCVVCTRHKAAQMEQFMGELPYDRVNLTRAFLKLGIDYAGPFKIYMRRGRGQKTHKAYVCVFVCMSTKAVHFELVGDLTTESFLAALRRFSSRRGACTDIYSDNGSNFIGANNHLRSLFHHLQENNSNISGYLAQQFINWHFNAPAAPHTGGLFESAVKPMKFHLRRVIGNTTLAYEEFNTMIVEIEAIMNSRPLCLVSPDQLDPLTPAHFLIGGSMKRIPEEHLVDRKQSLLTRWQLLQQFNVEYLTSLQRRVKWCYKTQNIKLGDVVVIKEVNDPSAQWALGVIQNIHPGKDGLVRTVTIKTQSAILKRPVQKICRLPIESTDSTGAEMLTNPPKAMAGV